MRYSEPLQVLKHLLGVSDMAKCIPKFRWINCLLSVFVLFLLLGCTKQLRKDVPIVLPPKLAFNSLKVGLLADSQIQTMKSLIRVPLLSGKPEDIAVPVSRRPPALNFYSKNNLKFFLKELIKERVDIILYLGDAANNGCNDEIEDVFKILRNVRKNSQIPVYFVIGNHDYLGRGNTPYMPDRIDLCDSSEPEYGKGRNMPITKFDLIKRVSAFNLENKDITGDWKYSDNFVLAEHFQRCVENSPEMETKGKLVPQHQKPGCFLTGHVLNEKLKLELLLLDTSDYADKWFVYDVALLKKGFAGMTGWISTPKRETPQSGETIPSQLEVLVNLKSDIQLDARILVSHYPLDQLGPNLRKVFPAKGLPCQLTELYEPLPKLGNFWVSGHTHEFPKIQQQFFPAKDCKKDKEYMIYSLNIGSTSDSKETENGVKEPHAVVASIVEGTFEKYNNPIYVNSIIDTSQLKCKRIAQLLKAQPDTRFPDYYPVANNLSGYSLFGIDTRYQESYWKEIDTIHAFRNLDIFVEYLKTNPELIPPGLSPDEIEVCIAREASINEEVNAIKLKDLLKPISK